MKGSVFMPNSFDQNTFINLLNITDGNAQPAIDYMAACVPDHLYKFYSLSDGSIETLKELDYKKISTLENNSNWFDLPSKQNDPLDMKMAYIDTSKLSQQTAVILSKAVDEIFNNLCLCSFIDSFPENLPMWAFYSNNYKGYCIKYRIEKKALFQKVLYEDNRMPIASIPSHFVDEAIQSSKLGYETEGLKWYRYILTVLFSTKHSSWKAENEYRIWYPADHGYGTNVSNKDLGIVPEDVFLGKDCLNCYKEKIIAICQNNLHCRCWNTGISERKILDYTLVLPPK